jgi:hypothetical protein
MNGCEIAITQWAVGFDLEARGPASREKTGISRGMPVIEHS